MTGNRLSSSCRDEPNMIFKASLTDNGLSSSFSMTNCSLSKELEDVQDDADTELLGQQYVHLVWLKHYSVGHSA